MTYEEEQEIYAEIEKRIPGCVRGMYYKHVFKLILEKLVEQEEQIKKLKEATNEN